MGGPCSDVEERWRQFSFHKAGAGIVIYFLDGDRWGAGQVTRLHTDTLVTCFTAHRGHLYYATVRGAVLRSRGPVGGAGAEQVLAPDPALGRVHCVGAGGAVLVTGHGEGRAR